MSSPELKGATTIVVDGYNLLLDLAEEALVSEERDRDVARARLGDALEEWARLRSCRVVLVWDGSGRLNSAGTAPRERVREVYVAAAEADDFIVEEVRRLREEGRRPGVVTRDRGLLGRLPKSVVELGHEQVGADLRALAADPLRAPDLVADDVAAEMSSRDPELIDTSKLPRRKQPRDAPGPTPAARPHRAGPEGVAPTKGRAQRPPAQKAKPGARSGSGAGAGGAPERDAAVERERQAREEAKRKKQARRERFRRAQERKQGTEDKDKDQNKKQDGKARNKKNQSGKKKRGRKK
jgi:hypothetical protein